jgi:hypothetical protein
MAVPSSGELKLWDDIWNQEIGASQGENSLHSASVYAGFSTPDAMSDFYGWSDTELPQVSGVTFIGCGVSSVNVRACANSNGNDTSTTCFGFYFGTSTNRTSNTKYNVCGPGIAGSCYCKNFTGLTYNRRYYFWAFACNVEGEVSQGCSCVTTPVPPYSPTFYQYCRNGSAMSMSNYFPRENDTTPPGIDNYWLNPYTGGTNYLWSTNGAELDTGCSTCYSGGCSSCVATNAKTKICWRWAGNASGGSGQSDLSQYACLKAYNDSIFNVVDRSVSVSNLYQVNGGQCTGTPPTRCIGHANVFYANPFANYSPTSYQGRICHCFVFNSDIRLKTDINYL